MHTGINIPVYIYRVFQLLFKDIIMLIATNLETLMDEKFSVDISRYHRIGQNAFFLFFG